MNDNSYRVIEVDINEILPNRFQPRIQFDEEEILELSDSIKEHGILQPLVVRPRANGRYQIVAGERRWRAARIAGLSEVPVVVKELDDHQTLEIALVENLVREDLNPVEEALGYRTLADEFSMTQEQIASRVGKSRPAVANALRLLSLPEDVLDLLKNGDISSGHAKALLPLEAKASAAVHQVIKDGLSVRQTEALVKKALSGQREAQKAPPSPSFYKETEIALRDVLSRKVKVSAKKDGKGELTIEFYSQEELKEFAAKLASK